MHIMYIVQNNCNRADTLIFSYEHNVSLLHITIVVLLCFSVQQSNSINKFSINVIGELSATKWISSFANENPISSFPLWDKIFQYNNGVKTLKDVCKSLQSNKIYAKMGLGSTGKEKKNLCYCVGILVVTFLLGR